MKNRYRLLAVDIDGTLVDGTGQVSHEDKEALFLAMGAGIIVCLATGRSPRSSSRYIEELSLDGYHIFFDGALVSHAGTGERVRASYIDLPLLDEMIAFAGGHGIDLELYSADSYFAGRETWSVRANRRYFDIEARIGDLAELCRQEPIVRAQIVTTSEVDQERAVIFLDHFAGRLDFTQARSEAYPETVFNNILSPGVSKGEALLALAARLGIAPEETAAVGDWINDIPMIAAAGLGIAMGNACDDLKKIADHVTLDAAGHGLAAAIKELLL